MDDPATAVAQQAEPFGVVEGFAAWVVGELFKGVGHADEAELIELVGPAG
jgi:hypothetical protein